MSFKKGDRVLPYDKSGCYGNRNKNLFENRDINREIQEGLGNLRMQESKLLPRFYMKNQPY